MLFRFFRMKFHSHFVCAFAKSASTRSDLRFPTFLFEAPLCMKKVGDTDKKLLFEIASKDVRLKNIFQNKKLQCVFIC